jgi:hypothetical protein
MARMPDEPEDGMLFNVIPYDYASEIAYIVSNWARLEYDIDAVIWDLAGLYDSPRIGACLTAQYSTVVHRFNALISIARLRGVPDFEIAKLNKFKDRALGLSDRRNRVVHDPWLTAVDYRKKFEERTGKTYRLQKTARAKLEYDYKPITIEELAALKDAIEAAITEFREIRLNPTIDTWDA